MQTITDKTFWPKSLKPYMAKSNAKGAFQVFNTFIPFALLWVVYAQVVQDSLLWAIPFACVMALFVLRFFVLMHDCGHNALFKSNRINKIVGYLLGVITGMPQYVWSKHHAYHHKTNGDWEKYQGPLSVITTQEFAKLSPKQKKLYRLVRHPVLFVPIGGFLYVLFNPRFNWFVGLMKLSVDVLKNFLLGNFQKANQLLKNVPSKKWKTPKEFRHQSYNNITLLTVWFFMIQALGAAEFFSVYVLTLTLSGGFGILFFTVQHNFEGAYASDTARTDYDRAALEGTSYLKLPGWLNWFSADIAYHHIHHLSSTVPNYNLVQCHRDFKDHFQKVRRISIKEIPHSLNYLLWDPELEKLVSIKEFEHLGQESQLTSA